MDAPRLVEAAAARLGAASSYRFSAQLTQGSGAAASGQWEGQFQRQPALVAVLGHLQVQGQLVPVGYFLTDEGLYYRQSGTGQWLLDEEPQATGHVRGYQPAAIAGFLQTALAGFAIEARERLDEGPAVRLSADIAPSALQAGTLAAVLPYDPTRSEAARLTLWVHRRSLQPIALQLQTWETPARNPATARIFTLRLQGIDSQPPARVPAEIRAGALRAREVH